MAVTGNFVAYNWLVAHVDHAGDECLIWPYGRMQNGYGSVMMDGRNMAASRAMCFLAHGEPPSLKMHAAHTCGKGHEGCVNPNHLAWKTPKENRADQREHGTDIGSLTADQVREIRQLLRCTTPKLTQKEIGARFGVSRSVIDRIKRGHNYAWVPEWGGGDSGCT